MAGFHRPRHQPPSAGRSALPCEPSERLPPEHPDFLLALLARGQWPPLSPRHFRGGPACRGTEQPQQALAAPQSPHHGVPRSPRHPNAEPSASRGEGGGQARSSGCRSEPLPPVWPPCWSSHPHPPRPALLGCRPPGLRGSTPPGSSPGGFAHLCPGPRGGLRSQTCRPRAGPGAGPVSPGARSPLPKTPVGCPARPWPGTSPPGGAGGPRRQGVGGAPQALRAEERKDQGMGRLRPRPNLKAPGLGAPWAGEPPGLGALSRNPDEEKAQ